MSTLVPYSSSSSNDVGLIESYRLRREERQMNANLERTTRNWAVAEVSSQQASMSRIREAQRAHVEKVQDIALAEERAHYGIDAVTRCYTHAVEAVSGDRGLAVYVEPMMQRVAHRIGHNI